MTPPIPDIDDLASRFHACALARNEWTHEAHLTMGLWHLHRYTAEESLWRLREGIRQLNASMGNINSATSGYHETITRAYVHLLSEFLATCPDGMHLGLRVTLLWNSVVADRNVLDRKSVV